MINYKKREKKFIFLTTNYFINVTALKTSKTEKN